LRGSHADGRSARGVTDVDDGEGLLRRLQLRGLSARPPYDRHRQLRGLRAHVGESLRQQQQQRRQRHAGVWLPHTLLATLQAQLSERVATPSAAVREPHLRPLAAQLKTLLAAHTTAADQAMRVLLA